MNAPAQNEDGRRCHIERAVPSLSGALSGRSLAGRLTVGCAHHRIDQCTAEVLA